MEQRPEITLFQRAKDLAVLTIPVSVAVALACLLLFYGLDLTRLWVNNCEQPCIAPGNGEKLQSAATIFSGIVGAVLSGFIAARVALHILKKEEHVRDRSRRDAETEKKKVQNRESDALEDWLKDLVSLFLNYLKMVPRYCPDGVDDEELGKTLCVLHRRAQTLAPPRQLLGSIVKDSPLMEKALDRAELSANAFIESLRDSYQVIGQIDSPKSIESNFNSQKFIWQLGAISEFAAELFFVSRNMPHMSAEFHSAGQILQIALGRAKHEAETRGVEFVGDWT